MGDAEKGKQIYARSCLMCHSLNPGGIQKNGPNLHGIFGKKAGTAVGYMYSEAFKNINIIWTKENMNEFLTNPKVHIPDTKKKYPGLKNDKDRADVIAYVEQATK